MRDQWKSFFKVERYLPRFRFRSFSRNSSSNSFVDHKFRICFKFSDIGHIKADCRNAMKCFFVVFLDIANKSVFCLADLDR